MRYVSRSCGVTDIAPEFARLVFAVLAVAIALTMYGCLETRRPHWAMPGLAVRVR